jgi:type IV pilus assembly protein PilQ
MLFKNSKKISLLIVLIFLTLFGCSRSGPQLAKDPDRGAKFDVEVISPKNTGKNLRDSASKFSEEQTALSKLSEEERSSQKRRSNLYGSKNNEGVKASGGPLKVVDLNLEIKNLETIPITLKMDEINIRAALKLFASLVNRNIIIGEEVDGTISLDFDNVKWGSAVYAVLDMKNLVMEADYSSKLLRVHTKEKYVQLEKDKIDTTKIRHKNFSSLNDGSDVSIDLSDPNNASQKNSAVFKIYYQTSKDMAAKIKELISKDDPDGEPKIVEDDKNNQIVVNATERQLSKIESILDTFDVKKKQILIEAYIVNAKDTFERKLGARVGANYVNPSTGSSGNTTEQISGIAGSAAGTTDTSGAGLSASGLALGTTAGSLADFSFSGTSGIGIIGRLGMARLKVEINALEAEGLTETISNPKIYAMDGEDANMTQGQQIPYTVAGGSNIASSTQFVNANLNLKVKPKIIGNGKILLEIDLVNDSVSGTTSPPPIDKQNFKSKITIDDKSIAVLGGVYTTTKGQSIARTPLLGELPVIGNLFKSDKKQDDKTQLLVFITATII